MDRCFGRGVGCAGMASMGVGGGVGRGGEGGMMLLAHLIRIAATRRKYDDVWERSPRLCLVYNGSAHKTSEVRPPRPHYLP